MLFWVLVLFKSKTDVQQKCTNVLPKSTVVIHHTLSSNKIKYKHNGGEMMITVNAYSSYIHIECIDIYY